jgi:FkbH-like protein
MSMTELASESESVAEILATTGSKPAEYMAAARRLAAARDRAALEAVPVAVLSTFTFDLVVPYLVVEGARRGFALDARVAPFAQLELQALDGASALYAGAPRVIVIATRVEDIAAELADRFFAIPADGVDGALARYVDRIAQLVREVRARTTAHVVVANQPPLQRLAASLADAGATPSQQHAIGELNRRLAAACAAIGNVTILDVARLATEIGVARWYDAKLSVLARSPLGGEAQLALGRRLARHIRALLRPPCKCLVLDLDNTLWGGVLGEDGIGGIALGEDYPGSVFKAFQRAIAGYRDRGVLLAIASKNNDADVVELFGSHKDLVLGLGDFAARQIHWNDKATSMRAIAAELDIGVDALALFDDSPVERAWVRDQLPEATVIEVPRDPLHYVAALDDSGAFDHLVITHEDRQRARAYQDEAQRRDLEVRAASPEEFLRALAMRVTIGPIDRATMARAAQLLGKTNQFNVTTRRYSEAELAQRLARDGAIGLWMRVADRYGDSGLVGVALAEPVDGAAYRLDSFLMSCRVLGRQAERALLHAVATRARRAGATELLGEFIPTKKNAVAAGFFAAAGFSPIADRANWWRLELAADAVPPNLFEIIEESGISP